MEAPRQARPLRSGFHASQRHFREPMRARLRRGQGPTRPRPPAPSPRHRMAQAKFRTARCSPKSGLNGWWWLRWEHFFWRCCGPGLEGSGLPANLSRAMILPVNGPLVPPRRNPCREEAGRPTPTRRWPRPSSRWSRSPSRSRSGPPPKALIGLLRSRRILLPAQRKRARPPPPMVASRAPSARVLRLPLSPVRPVSYTHLTLPTNREV